MATLLQATSGFYDPASLTVPVSLSAGGNSAGAMPADYTPYQLPAGSDSPYPVPAGCDSTHPMPATDPVNAVALNASPPTKPPWYKRHSHQAASSIREAPSLAAKQAAVDTYLDKKIDKGDTPDQNAANVLKKAHELCQHLDPQDADLLMTRSSYFSQHMSGLCKQKKLNSLWSSGDSSAAKVAFAADRQLNLDQALELVVSHIRTIERADQGPHARQAAMCEARNAVAEAVAFPKPPIWYSQLDAVIQQEVSRAATKAPGTRATVTADRLNSTSNYKTEKIMSAYFYSKLRLPVL